MNGQRLKKQGFANHRRKLIFRLIVIGLLAYLIYTPRLVAVPPRAVLACQLIGMTFIFVGILWRVLATITIGGNKDAKVVDTEVYSICRNPLYLGSLLMAIGVGMVSARPDFLLLVVVGYLAIFIPMMLNEARWLRERFSEYEAYAQRVPMFLPKFSLWQGRECFQINYRLVCRSVCDASVALLVVPLFLLIESWNG